MHGLFNLPLQRLRIATLPRERLVVQRRNSTAGEGEGVRVGEGEVVDDAGFGRVHVPAAEGFAVDLFAEGGFDEGWAGEEDGALVLDDDVFWRRGFQREVEELGGGEGDRPSAIAGT